MDTNIQIFLGYVFIITGIVHLFLNRRLARQHQEKYTPKGKKGEKKISYYIFYLRGLIIAIGAILIGLYAIDIL